MAYPVTTIGYLGDASPLNATNPDEKPGALDAVLGPLGLLGQSKGLLYGVIGGAVIGLAIGFSLSRGRR